MSLIMLSHKVADFDKWLEAFNAHLAMRQEAGLSGERVFHTADDPNMVHILMNVSDMDKFNAFTQSDDLKQIMQKAGVLEEPKLTILGAEASASQAAG